MYSKVTILDHPVHPMLVPFVIGSYAGTLFGAIVYAFVANPFWFHFSIACNAIGIVMAFVAAIPGFIDWATGIPKGVEAKSDGVKHMALNLTALAVFAVNLLLNANQWGAAVPVGRFSILLPTVGVLLSIGAGYLGWTLVQKHHVGIIFSKQEETCIHMIPSKQSKMKRAA